MSLLAYHKKRSFKATPEPEGKASKASQQKTLHFVVQQHAASTMHYDVRLEMDGVLKSWAVPKGPSLDPHIKHLAVKVEDHPLEYRNFEGVIPKGNYGAGEVIIWDRGTYESRTPGGGEKDLLKDLKKGHITFVLHGKKLKGEFALIKNEHFAKNSWLLIKKGDEFARAKDMTKDNKSVKSGKTVVELKPQEEAELKTAPRAAMPKTIKPMLATLAAKAFNDPAYIFEIKWDGYRAIGSYDGKTVNLKSRNDTDFTLVYGQITEAMRNLERPVVFDGEIVVTNSDGHARFEWLQSYTQNPKGHLLYYVFDLLWCDGHDLRDWPLSARKKLLKKIIPKNSPVRYSDEVVGDGKRFFASAKRQQLEGIMAKKHDGVYQAGVRSKDWLKIKTGLRQEFVIGGFTEPRGSREDMGAVIVGVQKGGKLMYASHVGVATSVAERKALRKRLEKLERKSSPFVPIPKSNTEVHWVQPKLLCEVKFQEWTGQGQLRQPIFLGIRSDKSAKEVIKEVPKMQQKSHNIKTPQKDAGSAKGQPNFEFTHRDKVFWPKAGYTKGDLVDYYTAVTPLMLPYLLNRPQSMLRQPNGIKGPAFFQKDIASLNSDWIQTVEVYSESNQKTVHYLVCDSKDSLLYMAQLGSIEINPWSSTVKHLSKPDWAVIDLDPEGVPFTAVVETAQAVKKVCDTFKIDCYPKTSGKTGIHIFIPLDAKYTYEQTRQFAEVLANLTHEQAPHITSVERSPAKRRHKVYLDFLQNNEGQTLAAPYSVRPTPEASVSTPLHWSEVNKRLDPTKFTIKTALKRFKSEGDLWKPVLGKGIDMKKILAKLLASQKG